MTRRDSGVLGRGVRCLAFAGGLAMAAGGAAMAQPASGPGQQMRHLVIGYVALTHDAHYDPQRAYDRVQVRPLGRPLPGAEEGVKEASDIGSVLGIDFALKHAEADSAEALAAQVDAWIGQGVHFVITDLPAKALLTLADDLKGKPVLLFNASAPQDSLRGKDCRANILDTIPSDAMRTDALMQYLVSKKWRNILVLQGPLPRDKEIAAALARSAKRLGATLTTKPFQLTNNPRLRDESNVALMTAGADEDVVWVIDSDGDFARYVPYQVNQPRPVVGSAGLVAQAWTWAWDEHGALQLEARFEKLAGRRMDSEDWAAWAAVKALVESTLRTNSTDFAKLRDFLLGSRLSIDGYKGNPMSFRPWDHQMRQPMLVATENAVIARAPIAGFLHQTDVLDTLGIDKPESHCAF